MLWAAGHYTVFDDEAFSCLRYTMPAGEMVRALWDGAEPDPPLYYLMENLSIRAFGIGPTGIRFLSIILFLFGLHFTRLAGEAWFDAATGRRAMLLAALHPAHLMLGFAARWYSAMFCAVAILTWITGRTLNDSTRDRRWIISWGLSAAVVCYINYFGVVMVALLWLVAIVRDKHPGHWALALLIAVISYAPWMPPFARQLTAFPQFTGSWQSVAGSAGRTLMALMAGNLASPRAWWVWAPMGLWLVLIAVLLRMQLRPLWPIAVVVAGAFVAGTVTRTIIDKYVMTFSGLACILVAATMWPTGETPNAAGRRIIARAAQWMLVVGWIGCGVNLVTEKNWSSLRLLDPFESAASKLAGGGVDYDPSFVATHPSARYYLAIELERPTDGELPEYPQWRRTAGPTESSDGKWINTPASILNKLSTEDVTTIATLEGATFADDPDWRALRGALHLRFKKSSEQPYLEDPDAEWKDRIDPVYSHPRHRVRATVWEKRKD